MTVMCYFLNAEEFKAKGDERLALARSRPSDQGATLVEVTKPGAMWFIPWWHDPTSLDAPKKRKRALKAIGAGEGLYLSRFYWEDHSLTRPPICVLCPDGREWCVDSKSNNGDGWKVSGSPPLITCSPSIQTPGYHGHLTDGVFGPAVDANKRKKQ